MGESRFQAMSQWRPATAVWFCACLLLIPVAGVAGPRWECEAGVQAVRSVRDEGRPVGLPVSGFAASRMSVWHRPRLTAFIGLGYDDASARNRIATQDTDTNPDPDRMTTRLQSLVIPSSLLVSGPGRHSFIELCTEMRVLLRATRLLEREDESIPSRRFVGNEGLHAVTLAIGAGVGLQWHSLGGQTRLTLRWVEDVTNASAISGVTIRGHAARLAVGWSRQEEEEMHWSRSPVAQ